MKKIVLLNFEGAVITVEKINENVFFVYDQTNKFIEEFSREGFKNFINGDITVTDSMKKVWNYTKEPTDAKPHDIQVDIFLNEDPALTTIKILKEYFKGNGIEPIHSHMIEDFQCVFSEISRKMAGDKKININETLYKYLK